MRKCILRNTKSLFRFELSTFKAVQLRTHLEKQRQVDWTGSPAKGVNSMEKIEIPRFLLDYFDSTTIRTPLSTIQGYAGVMLKGMAGPLTDEQRRFLEIIHHTAEQLNNHFSFVLHNQHYIAWDQQANMGQFFARDLVDEFKESLRP